LLSSLDKTPVLEGGKVLFLAFLVVDLCKDIGGNYKSQKKG